MTEAEITTNPDPWLKARECAKLANNISLPTFYRRVKDGTFPKPIKLGGMRRWARSDMLGAMARLKAARDAAE